MKVSIKDFQIVKSASLEFIPGLTVIQGESNNGKSALFRAIKSCIYNEPGTTNVRIGCKNYMVGIEHKGHKVIFQKGENSLYMIDGKQYNKVGKVQVPEVAEALGINAISVNDNIEKINFWDQMEKPFLLDRNSSELFRFIVDSGEDDNLNSTLRSMVHDKNELNTQKNLKEGSINTLKQQIDENEKLLAGSEEKIELCEKVIAFSPMTSKLLTVNNNIANITSIREEIAKESSTISTRREIKKELDDISSKLSYNISIKEQLQEKILKYQSLQETIKGIDIQLNDKVEFNKVIPTISKNIDTLSKVKEKVAKANELSKIINSTKVERLQISISHDEVTKLSTLKSVLERINKLQQQISSIQDNVTAMNKDIEPILKEYSSIDVCPYCGNKLHGKEVSHNE